MSILSTRAIYRNGILRPDTKLDLPEGATVQIQITPESAIDPKDALMNEVATLQYRYAEFAQEEHQLADAGLAHYSHILEQEEKKSASAQTLNSSI
jgi:predicted DNA-binding antitoxin AbrB/MazE fold protein